MKCGESEESALTGIRPGQPQAGQENTWRGRLAGLWPCCSAGHTTHQPGEVVVFCLTSDKETRPGGVENIEKSQPGLGPDNQTGVFHNKYNK